MDTVTVKSLTDMTTKPTKKSRGARNRKAQALRRATADRNTALREARTEQEQLDVLDRRLGRGVGAKKERRRLQALIEADRKPQQTKHTESKK